MNIEQIIKKIPFSTAVGKGILYMEYLFDFIKFVRMNSMNKRQMSAVWKDRIPCLMQKTGKSEFDRHYFYHLAWASRVLSKTLPKLHIDIASHLYFCSIVSAFVKIAFYDYRPADIKLDNLESKQGDLLQLPFDSGSVSSLSCMHVVEHIGLGRYGNLIIPDGDLQAIKELVRVLAEDGDLLFVVPIGRPRVCFNAHRVYSHKQVMEFFADLSLKEFALIPDDAEHGSLIYSPAKELITSQEYGCGCYWFRKGQ